MPFNDCNWTTRDTWLTLHLVEWVHNSANGASVPLITITWTDGETIMGRKNTVRLQSDYSQTTVDIRITVFIQDLICNFFLLFLWVKYCFYFAFSTNFTFLNSSPQFCRFIFYVLFVYVWLALVPRSKAAVPNFFLYFFSLRLTAARYQMTKGLTPVLGLGVEDWSLISGSSLNFKLLLL